MEKIENKYISGKKYIILVNYGNLDLNFVIYELNIYS